MPLPVSSLVAYLTRGHEDGIEWRPKDFETAKFIKAIKGDPIKGYAQILWNGRYHRIEDGKDGRVVAFQLFGEMAADYLRRQHAGLLADTLTFVPIPSSQTTLASPADHLFVSLVLAKKLAAACGKQAEVEDVLRWQSQMSSARSGGTRAPGYLYDHLVVTKKPLGTSPHILIDDVCTSGGHLRAAATRLKEAGANVVLALCAGRTVHDQVDDPYQILEVIAPDYP